MKRSAETAEKSTPDFPEAINGNIRAMKRRTAGNIHGDPVNAESRNKGS